MPIPKELLDVLACPKCKGYLTYVRNSKNSDGAGNEVSVPDRKNEKLICNKCRLRFGVIDGDIPNMLIEEAEKF